MAIGNVISSFWDTGGGKAYRGGMLNNILLRVGEVQAIFYPSDDQNFNKKVIEYRVAVQHRDNGTASTRVYDHCVISELFGGVADYFRYTLRADPAAGRTGTQKTFEPGLGSKVALLCINGETINGLILSGIRDFKADADPDTSDELGHNLAFEFNGVQFTINKDGELTLAVKGPTDPDGTVNNDIGSSVKIDKDGNITINSSSKVTVVSGNVELGQAGLSDTPEINGVVLAGAIEPFTGLTYAALQSSSQTVTANK